MKFPARVKAALVQAVGFLCLGLGAVGLFLPLWPTTPFLLVAVSCFAGAPRVRTRICRIPFFKAHIENYQNRTGLSRKTVAGSLLFLWGMLALSAVLVRTAWMAALLTLVGLAVTVHILHMARAKGAKKSELL